MDLVLAGLKHLQQVVETVHGHPGTVGATRAGRACTAGGRLHELLIRRGLLHLVEDAVVRGDDELLVTQLGGRLDELGGGTHHIRHIDHRLG